MILLCKTFIAFRGNVIIPFFKLVLSVKKSHYTKIPISYLVFMIVLVNRFLLNKNFLGISLWPFIILKRKELKQDKVFINHEKIHLRQQVEFLIIPFYLWYLIEYVCRLIQYRSTKLAYRNISFEREMSQSQKHTCFLEWGGCLIRPGFLRPLPTRL